MDAWPPSMVDALAARHEVVLFDNAGVGQTSAVPSPGSLSVTAMTTQTSALISALGLHRPAVLGWSLGGMVAQALAVTHPAQVSRLILAATTVRTGKARPLPPHATVFGPASSQYAAQLFPEDRAAAVTAYLNAIQQYRDSSQVSAATLHSQYLAAERWLAGQDPAGHLVGDIRVPTLVADGTQDQFVGPANECGRLFHPAGHGVTSHGPGRRGVPGKRARVVKPAPVLCYGICSASR